jgi:hypothetical protein
MPFASPRIVLVVAVIWQALFETPEGQPNALFAAAAAPVAGLMARRCTNVLIGVPEKPDASSLRPILMLKFAMLPPIARTPLAPAAVTSVAGSM